MESLDSGLKSVSWETFRGWMPSAGYIPSLDVSGGVYVPYVGTGGAPVVLDVARSLGLPSDLAVGKSTPISLQVIVSYFQNFSYVNNAGAVQTFQPELYIINNCDEKHHAHCLSLNNEKNRLVEGLVF